jgi:hypothetical protein
MPAAHYRVDLWLAIGRWAEYTSLKRGVTLEMARALAEHLRRNQTNARIIDMETNKEVS